MARLFKVTVNEFSIGMGPKLISKKSEKTDTAYSLRILPIGGFVSMEGEDESSQNSGAFCNKPVWQRMIITAAGAAFNILLGILVMTVIMASTTLVSNRVGQFNEGALSAEKIQIDDTIVNVAGVATHTANQVS
ncbi:MAG: site-2 protease family protein, partial [Clostridia bacterium]|nr:site-2 protease family protein [Clostridia bacterium]